MEYTQVSFHLINLFLFLIALGSFIRSAVKIHKVNLHSALKFTFLGACLHGIFVSGIFIVLQADWVMSNHNVNVGDATSWAWLIFDFALVFFMIAVAQSLSVIITWVEFNTRHGLNNRWYDGGGKGAVKHE